MSGGMDRDPMDGPKAPSSAATAVANELLLIPNAMGVLAQQMAVVAKQMNQIADDFESLVRMVVPKKPAPAEPVTKNFFLNEAHETHTTKSEARRERRDARFARQLQAFPADRKAEGKGKPSVVPAVRRKRGATRTVPR